ncbi:uncharacterized protein LOC34622439 [Cyclospora cayetanensis]|nr:uncharacterized protein LOC34622439 [Cyclospora cayetanensis]
MPPTDEKQAVVPEHVYRFPHPNEFPEVQKLATTDCSLLLASSSEVRRQLFAKAGVPFGAFSAPLEEDDVQQWLEAKHPELSTDRRTLLIAQLKADAAVHALRGPNTQHLLQLRLHNQILNLPESERLPLLALAESAARRTGGATAAVAALASFAESCVALEAADGRPPVLIAVDTGVSLHGRVMFKPRDKKEAECFLQRYSETEDPIIVTTSVVLVDLCDELENPPWDPNAAVPAGPEFPHKCRSCGKFQQQGSAAGRENCSPCSCPLPVVHAASILDEPGGPAAYRFNSREVFTVHSEVRFNKMDAETRKRIIEEGDVLYSAGAILIEKGEMAKYLKSVSGCPHSVIGFPLGHLKGPLSQLLKKIGN